MRAAAPLALFTLPSRGRVGEASSKARCEPGWGDLLCQVKEAHPTPLANARDPPPPGEGEDPRTKAAESILAKRTRERRARCDHSAFRICRHAGGSADIRIGARGT